jgi:hypothetical protein
MMNNQEVVTAEYEQNTLMLTNRSSFKVMANTKDSDSDNDVSVPNLPDVSLNYNNTSAVSNIN